MINTTKMLFREQKQEGAILGIVPSQAYEMGDVYKQLYLFYPEFNELVEAGCDVEATLTHTVRASEEAISKLSGILKQRMDLTVEPIGGWYNG